jgi:hypothetical protein
MSSRIVFDKMRTHYFATGEVMREEQFVTEIANKFPKRDVIDGLIIFDSFLDKQRGNGYGRVNESV